MDPYTPPAAPLQEPPGATPRGFRVLPVIVGGFVVDYLGSNLLGLMAGVGAGAWAAASGPPERALDMARAILASPRVLAALMAIGSVMSVLGAYVAARWAGSRHLAHALCAGAIPLALNLPAAFSGVESAAPAWLYPLGLALQLPLAAIGGKLAERRALRLARPGL